MALILKVNSVDRSNYVKWQTLQKTEVLTKEVDRMEFDIVKTPSKSSIPDVSDDVTLEEDGIKIFGGIIVEKNEVIEGGLLLGYKIRCKDYSQLLDRKLVTKSYGTATARSIILDIIATYTTGFTTSNVPVITPNVGSIKFNYEQVTRCLAQLADQLGWDWYVDYDKDIHFFEESTDISPFNFDDSNGMFDWKTLEINKSVLQLKNSVYVRGGEYKKTVSEANAYDSYKAQSGQSTFPLAFKYDNITVKKNNVVQTIGTDQQTDPLTVDLLYNFNEKFIKFSSALSTGDSVVVYGDAYIPIIAQAQDAASITAYGEYQSALVDKSIASVNEAQTRAKAELKKYAGSVFEAQLKTHQTGLRVGQRITLTSTIRNITKTFKINRIVGKARASGQMEYTVYMIASGQITFTDIMVDLLGQDKKNIVIATNEVLQRIQILSEEILATDTLTGTARARPYVWGIKSTTGAILSYFLLKEDGFAILQENGSKLITYQEAVTTIDPNSMRWNFATWN